MLAAPQEQVVADARRHGIVLFRPLARAGLLATVGGFGVFAGWPVSVGGAILLVLAAIVATVAVWRWERTRVVVTTEKLFVVSGIVHRRAAAVRLHRVPSLEIEESLFGRLLGYGTLVAGDLEIRYVPRARRFLWLVDRLGHAPAVTYPGS